MSDRVPDTLAVIVPCSRDTDVDVEPVALKAWFQQVAKMGLTPASEPSGKLLPDGTEITNNDGEVLITLGEESGLYAWRVEGRVA